MSSNDMQIGIGFPANIPGVRGKQLIEWAKKADGGPFSSLGLIDRLVYDNYDPLIALAAAAGAAAAGGAGAGPVAAWFDALRGQVFGALCLLQDDRVETVVPPTLATPEQIVERAPARARLVVGDGAVRYAEEVTRWIGTAPVPLESLPPAATLLLALVDREGTGRAIEDPVTAEPVYGRPAEAQARWEARHGRPLPDSPRPAG